jgi:hypothetical protein
LRKETRLKPVLALIVDWFVDVVGVVAIIGVLGFGFMQAATWNDARKANATPVEEQVSPPKAAPAIHFTNDFLSHRNPVLWI